MLTGEQGQRILKWPSPFHDDREQRNDFSNCVDIAAVMADTSAAAPTEHRRKRVRKGTKSCWECKRRKIRCDFLDSETVCAGCLDRGTKCVSQEFADDPAPPSGAQLGQRMGRVEILLEKLMQKLDSNGIGLDRDHALVAEARESLGIDVLTPSSSTSNQYENAPIFSLFDNSVFGRSSGDGSSVQNDASLYASPPTSSSQAASPMNQTQSKLDRLRRTLLALLPSQQGLDELTETSDGWWLIRRHFQPFFVSTPDFDLTTEFSIRAVSQSHPIVISRLLLLIALSIQQLPHNYDATRLQFADSLKDRKEKIVNAIANVTSDDELIGSLEGIECLILQGIYHINAGNFRRSWLSFRRAANIAQLMGLHRPSLRPNDPADTQAQRKNYLWFQIIKIDQFLSLILGLPSASGSSDLFPFDEGAKWLTTEDKYNIQLSTIAGLIVERNQTEPSHAFSTTQNIDEKLDNLAKQMPSSWWEFDKYQTFERNKATVSSFDRVLVQMYHFELESLVHLPYMLRAAADRRYEYSRLSCLSASRKLLQRWQFLRKKSNATFTCKVIDFQALKAALTLLLGILQPSQTVKDPIQIRGDEEDRELVDSVKSIFEERQAIESDVVLAQSVDVLNKLQSINLNENGKGVNLRLTIPHFGTISVGKSRCRLAAAGPGPVPHMQENGNGNGNGNTSFQVDSALQNWQSNMPMQPPYPNPPSVLTFMSSQFPPLTADMGEWSFSEDDTLLFDSLLNSDLEWSWDF